MASRKRVARSPAAKRYRETKRYQDVKAQSEAPRRDVAKQHDDASKEWSDEHKHGKPSPFSRSWPAARKEAYYRAFVSDREKQDRKEWRTWLRYYLFEYEGYDMPAKEWMYY